MGINGVSAQQNITQAKEVENKAKAKEQKEVSFWSKEWTAGNAVREYIGWDGLADWLDDKDKVCTDGKDDGKLGFGETMESFGKGLAGLVKGVMNHPIATAVTMGVGAAAVAVTGGAILPVMIAAGATIGTGMIGVGAYKATKANTDAEAKQAWETIGTGTFAIGASALGAKSALKQANSAGVKNAIPTKNPIKNIINCFKSTPRSLEVSSWHIDSHFRIAFIQKYVDNQIKGLAKNNSKITPEMQAAVKQLRDDEAAIIEGIKRSVREGYYKCPELNQSNYHIERYGAKEWYTTSMARETNRVNYTHSWKGSRFTEEQSFSELANHYRDVDFAALAKDVAVSKMKRLSSGFGYNYLDGDNVYLNIKENPITRFYAKQKIKNLGLESGENPAPYLKRIDDEVTFFQNIQEATKARTKELMDIK